MCDMDDEITKTSKVTPRKSRCEENRGLSSSSCSKKLVRKAKLSLQKTIKHKRVIRTLIATDLNESDDFKTGQTFSDKHKTRDSKTGQTFSDKHKTRDSKTGQTFSDKHKTRDSKTGQTFSDKHKTRDSNTGQTFSDRHKTRDSNTGQTFSDKHKTRDSKTGQTFSDRHKTRDSKTGQTFSDRHKTRDSNTGQTFSDKHKTRDSKTGQTFSDKHKTRDSKTGQTFSDKHKTRDSNTGQTFSDRHKTGGSGDSKTRQTFSDGDSNTRDNKTGQTLSDRHKTRDSKTGQTLSDRHKTDGCRDSKGEFLPSASELLASCPACTKDVVKEELKDHVKTCFQQFARLCSTDGKVNLPSTTRRDLSEQQFGMHDELVLCQLCQKDLSHLNSQRRTRHLNQCIDQAEATKHAMEEEEHLLEKAKKAVLDCPMCGKPLKTEAMRRSHLKKCAHSLGIPLQQMMDSVKLQDEHHRVQLAAGILPDSLRHRPTRKQSANEKKNAGKKVKSKLDEDLQLAIALSSSIADHQLTTDCPVSSHVVDRKKSKKKVKARDETPLLLLLSKQEAEQRIADKVTELLIPQEEDDDITALPRVLDSHLTRLAAVSVFTSFMQNNKDVMVWNKTGLIDALDDTTRITSLYYTEALMPPVEVSRVPAGSKPCRLSEIPGRGISNPAAGLHSEQQSVLEQQSGQQTEVDVHLPDQQTNVTHQEFVTSPEDLVVSTQTAVILAELAADSSATVQTTSAEIQDLSQASGFCPLEIQIESGRDVEKNLLSSLHGLVNCPDWSDVTVVTKDNVRLFAHKVFLAVRCPKLLQMVDTDNVIDLSPASDKVVLCILKYLYCGTVIVNRDCFNQVLELAQKLELKEYYNICKENAVRLGQIQTEDDSVSPCNEQSCHSKQVLNSFWSSSECDQSDDDEDKSSVEDANNEEEWREIRSSQRLKLSTVGCSVKSSLEEDDEDKSSVEDANNEEEWREIRSSQRLKLSTVGCSVKSSLEEDDEDKSSVEDAINEEEWREIRSSQRLKLSTVSCSVKSSLEEDDEGKSSAEDAINEEEWREIRSSQRLKLSTVGCSVKSSLEEDDEGKSSVEDAINEEEWREIRSSQRLKLSTVSCSVKSSLEEDDEDKSSVEDAINEVEWREIRSSQRLKLSTVGCSVKSSLEEDDEDKSSVEDAINEEEWREIRSSQRLKLSTVGCSVKSSLEEDDEDKSSVEDAINEEEWREIRSSQRLKLSTVGCSVKSSLEEDQCSQTKEVFEVDTENRSNHIEQDKSSVTLDQEQIQLQAVMKPFVGMDREKTETKASTKPSAGMDRQKVEPKVLIKSSFIIDREKTETKSTTKPSFIMDREKTETKATTNPSFIMDREKTETKATTIPLVGVDREKIEFEATMKQPVDTDRKTVTLRKCSSKLELRHEMSEQTSEQTDDSTEELFSDEEAEDSKPGLSEQTQRRSRVSATAHGVVHSGTSRQTSCNTRDYKHEAHCSERETSEHLYIVSSGESDEEGSSGKHGENKMSVEQMCFSNTAPLCHPSHDRENLSELNPVLSQLAYDECFIDQIDESVACQEISVVKSAESSEEPKYTKIENVSSSLSDESRKRKSSSSHTLQSVGLEQTYSDSRKLHHSQFKVGAEEPMSKRYKMSTPVSSSWTVRHELNMDEVSKIEYCSPASDTSKDVESDRLEKGCTPPITNEDALFVSPAIKKHLRSTFMLATPASATQAAENSVSIQNTDKSESSFIDDIYMESKSTAVCEYTPTPDKKHVIMEDTTSSGLMTNTTERCLETPLSSQGKRVLCEGDNSDSRKNIQFGADISSDSDIEIVGDNLDAVASQHSGLSPKFSSKTAKHSLTQTQISGEQDVVPASPHTYSSKSLIKPSSLNKSPTTASRNETSAASLVTSDSEELSSSCVQNDSTLVSASPVADVWEGFDDVADCPVELYADFGADADVESSPEKKVRSSQKKKRVSSGSEVTSVTPNRAVLSSQKHCSETTDQDDVNFFSDDSFMLDECVMEQNMPKSMDKKSQFKTPQHKKTGGKKKWVPPSPFTPMPDYDKMVTPNLKKAVDKFGLKPMCKKRMKLVLKDIYQQTHQYETDSDYEPDTDVQPLQVTKDSPIKSSQVIKSAPVTNKVTKSKASSKDVKKTDSKATQQNKKSTKTKITVEQKTIRHASTNRHKEVKSVVPQKTVSLQLDELSVSSSQESTCSDMPEESFVVDDEEFSASQQTGKPELHAQLMKFVTDKPDIHAKMLVYEPLELDWLKVKLTEEGIKCSIQKLMDFLDEKCITFTMKKMSKRNTRRKPTRRKKVNLPKSVI